MSRSTACGKWRLNTVLTVPEKFVTWMLLGDAHWYSNVTDSIEPTGSYQKGIKLAAGKGSNNGVCSVSLMLWYTDYSNWSGTNIFYTDAEGSYSGSTDTTIDGSVWGYVAAYCAYSMTNKIVPIDSDAGINLRTINITGGEDAENPELIAWLEANATNLDPASKVIYAGNVLIDLTADSVTEESLLSGVTAHGANGKLIVGTLAEYDGTIVVL